MQPTNPNSDISRSISEKLFSTTLLCKTWLAYTCRQHSSPILHFSTTLFPKILLQHFSTTLTLLKRFTATLFSKSSLEHLLYLTTLFPTLVYKECKKLWTWCSCAPATRHKTKNCEVKKLLHLPREMYTATSNPLRLPGKTLATYIIQNTDLWEMPQWLGITTHLRLRCEQLRTVADTTTNSANRALPPDPQYKREPFADIR